MTHLEKMEMVKTMMHIEDDSEDEVIAVYLHAAKHEILQWRYSYASTIPDDVPVEYEMTQVFAVIDGFSQIGAEGEVKHSEGSIARTFSYDTMIAYIRSHVVPIVRCL